MMTKEEYEMLGEPTGEFLRVLFLMQKIKPDALKSYLSSTKMEKIVKIFEDETFNLQGDFLKNYQKSFLNLRSYMMNIKPELLLVADSNYFNTGYFLKDNLNLSQAIDFYDGLSVIFKNYNTNLFYFVDSLSPYTLSNYVNNHDLLKKFLNSQYFTDKIDSPFNQKSFDKFSSKMFSGFRVKHSINDYKEVYNIIYDFFKSKNDSIQKINTVEDILINNIDLSDKYESFMDFLDEGNKYANEYQLKTFKKFFLSSVGRNELFEVIKNIEHNRFSKEQKIELFFDIFSSEETYKDYKQLTSKETNGSAFKTIRTKSDSIKNALDKLSAIDGFESQINTERGNKTFFLLMDYISYNLSLSSPVSLDSFGNNKFKVGATTFNNMSEAMLSLESMPMDMCVYINEKSKDRKSEIYNLILDRFTNGKYFLEKQINPFDKNDDLLLSFIKDLKKTYSDKEIFSSFVLSYKHPFNKEFKKDNRIYELRSLNNIIEDRVNYRTTFDTLDKTYLFNEFLQKFMGDNPNMVWDLKQESHPLVSFLENNSHLISNGQVSNMDLTYFVDIEKVFLKYTKLDPYKFTYLSTDINNQVLTLDKHLKQLIEKTYPHYELKDGVASYALRVFDYQRDQQRESTKSISSIFDFMFKKEKPLKDESIYKMGYVNGIYKENEDIDLLLGKKSVSRDSGIYGKTLNTYDELMNILNTNQDLQLSIEVQMKSEKLMIDNLAFIKQIKNLEDVLPMEVKHFYENSFNKYLVQSVSIYVNGMKKYNTMNSIIQDKEKNIFSRMSNREININPEAFKEKIESEAIRQLDLLEKELNHIETNILTQLSNESIKESNIQTRVLQGRKEIIPENNVLEINSSPLIKVLNKK